jgi:hypothetical protein
LEAGVYRSSDVWEAIKGNIIAFVGKWHVSSRVAACLTAIDELRDDYGPAESEPRHPDIDSGRPWPLPVG